MSKEDTQKEGHMKLSTEIRVTRKARGLTQQEAAEEIGVAGRTVGAWERSERFPYGFYYQALDRWLDEHSPERKGD